MTTPCISFSNQYKNLLLNVYDSPFKETYLTFSKILLIASAAFSFFAVVNSAVNPLEDVYTVFWKGMECPRLAMPMAAFTATTLLFFSIYVAGIQFCSLNYLYYLRDLIQSQLDYHESYSKIVCHVENVNFTKQFQLKYLGENSLSFYLCDEVNGSVAEINKIYLTISLIFTGFVIGFGLIAYKKVGYKRIWTPFAVGSCLLLMGVDVVQKILIKKNDPGEKILLDFQAIK